MTAKTIKRVAVAVIVAALSVGSSVGTASSVQADSAWPTFADSTPGKK